MILQVLGNFRIYTFVLVLFAAYHFKAMSQEQDPGCIFCKIIQGKEPANILYKDEDVIVFEDIKPASKLHFLTVPIRHIKDAKHLTHDDATLVDKMYSTAKRIISEKGFSVEDTRFGYHWPPFNSIKHIHLHAIAPESEMGFFAKLIFMKDSYWFVSPEYVRSLLNSKL